MRVFLRKFAHDERGATALEYSLIAGFVGITIIASVTLVGVELSTIFGNVTAGFK